MKCFGRVNGLNRCPEHANSLFPFCRIHKWQPLIFIIIVLPGLFADWSSIFPTHSELETEIITVQESVDTIYNLLQKPVVDAAKDMIKSRTGYSIEELETIMASDSLSANSDYKTAIEFYKKENYPQSIKYFKKSLVENDTLSNAMFFLGCLYVSESVGLQDKEESIYWFKKAANLGFPRANLLVGIDFFYGETTTKDFKKASKFFKKALELNCFEAASYLGEIAIQSNNTKEAFQYLAIAEKHNIGNGIFRLGNIYLKGLGIDKDSSKAYSYYKTAHSLGEDGASLEYARMMLNGYPSEKFADDGIAILQVLSDKNYAIATAQLVNHFCLKRASDNCLEWCEKGLVQGDELSHYVMGRIYEEGVYGKPVNLELAKEHLHIAKTKWNMSYYALAEIFKLQEKDNPTLKDSTNYWLERAGDSYSTQALEDLGQRLMDSDTLKAISLLKKVIKKGPTSGLSFFLLGKYYMNNGSPTKAEAYLQKGIPFGDTNCPTLLGMLYFNDTYGMSNPKKAMDLFQEGIKQKSPRAYYLLGYGYYYGYGIEKDEKKGLNFLFEASNLKVTQATKKLEELGYK